MNSRLWTDEDRKQLRRLYPDMPTAEVARRLGRSLASTYGHAGKLRLKKSAAYLASPDACRLRRGDNVGASCRFAKGHVPANKGLRRPGWFAGRMRETQFKKGQKSQTWKPVGTVLKDSDGYLRIKIRERRKGETGGWNPNVWPPLHVRNWRKVHGAVPKGHVVVFRDGNQENCDEANLELITRVELMRRNTIHNLPAALKEVIVLKGRIRAVVTKRRKRAA